MCLFILLNSNKDSLYSNESIYIILLQEEAEMEDLQLHLHGAQEADCKIQEKHSQQVTLRNISVVIL